MNVKARNLLGEDGVIYKSAGGALSIPTGRRVKAIFAHSAAVVDVTLVSGTGSDATTAVAIPAGATWLAWCSAVSLTSGAISAYLDEKST